MHRPIKPAKQASGSPRAVEWRSRCPISMALDLLGDAWSLLIVRDLMFKQRRSFRELMDGGEGIASNVLAQRLNRLQLQGLVQRRRDPADGRRWIYGLTAKGIDLAPVLVELVLWSSRHETTEAPAAVLGQMRRDRTGFIAETRARWRRGS